MSRFARALLFAAFCLASAVVAGALYIYRVCERAEGIENGTIPLNPNAHTVQLPDVRIAAGWLQPTELTKQCSTNLPVFGYSYGFTLSLQVLGQSL
jgi:hypothetical protein